jgi:hypothetical protein
MRFSPACLAPMAILYVNSYKRFVHAKSRQLRAKNALGFATTAA